MKSLHDTLKQRFPFCFLVLVAKKTILFSWLSDAAQSFSRINGTNVHCGLSNHVFIRFTLVTNLNINVIRISTCRGGLCIITTWGGGVCTVRRLSVYYHYLQRWSVYKHVFVEVVSDCGGSLCTN